MCVRDYAIAKHLMLSEIACKCGCGRGAMHVDCLLAWESFRAYVARPVIVSSGYRCPAHPESLLRPTSQHLLGRALDLIRVPANLFGDAALEGLAACGWRGIGRDRKRQMLHLDVRDGAPLVWDYVSGAIVVDERATEILRKSIG